MTLDDARVLLGMLIGLFLVWLVDLAEKSE